MEDAAARARRYEKALEMIWGLTRGKTGATAQAERGIAADALGLWAPGMHPRGIDHLGTAKAAEGSDRPSARSAGEPPVKSDLHRAVAPAMNHRQRP